MWRYLQHTMRVLLAIVSTDQCSLGFTVSILKTVNLLVREAQVNVEVVRSVQEAVTLAHGIEGLDALVAIRSSLTFCPEFVMHGLKAGPFVAGVYPLPTIDWGRVAAQKGPGQEELRFKGNTYNLDPSGCRQRGAPPGYLAVDTVELGAVVLGKAAIKALADKACRASVTDAQLCKAWGKDILVDMDHQCTNFGPHEFTGCVGMRATLR